jgi:RpiR family transcriptional regulator, carbohydrate utilization regulator
MNQQQLLISIKNKYSEMGISLRRVADLVLTDPERIADMNIQDIAHKSEVSLASITRFIKMLGYKNYKSFQMSLVREMTTDEKRTVENSGDTSITFSYGLSSNLTTSEEISKKVFKSNIQMLSDTMKTVSYEKIGLITDLILKARNLIFVAAGRSHIAAESGRSRFYRLGINTFCYWDAHEQIVAATTCTKDDLVIGISNYGHSASVVTSLIQAKKHGATTVCITSVENSPIVEAADHCLLTTFNYANLEYQPTKEAYEPASENIAQIVLIDCLYMNVVMRLGKECVYKINESTKALDSVRI